MKIDNIIAFILLGIMFLILFASSINDAATFDEIAHIGAGYTYLRYQDSRLNPEHPPLIKDLAAFPLLFLNLNFDISKPFWNAEDVHSRQWDAGRILLYESGNDPDIIVFWMRIPMMLLSILFGYLLFRWVRSIYGGGVALLVLIFYSFSPTFIAHSRYVTTDVAAAFGFFIGLASFTRFLEKQSPKRVLIAGLSLGIGLLLKFSIFLLIPIYGVLALLWAYLDSRENQTSFLKLLGITVSKTMLIGLIALAIIYGVYLFHVWNYPMDREFKDAEYVTSTYGFRPIVKLDLLLIKNTYLRPFGQYLMGLLMVLQRAIGGNTTYYWGEVSASGWRSYFPVAYLLKETLAFHIMSLLALLIAIRSVLYSRDRGIKATLDWMRGNFVLISSLFFVLFYWAYSIRSTLNIGVRHVLPTFPFIYLLVSRQLYSWFHSPSIEEPKNIFQWVLSAYESLIKPLPKLILVSLLIFIMIVSVGFAFPFYLSYYNEIVGIEYGYKYIVDSNYDWGQDLKRLADLAQSDPAFSGKKIYLHYFGGGSPAYYLKGQYVEWWSAKGAPPAGSYFAISVTILEGAWGKPVHDIKIKPEDTYSWLRGQEPIRRAGTSIFVYKIP